MMYKVVDRTFKPPKAERVDLTPKKEYKAPEYKVEKVDLSSNIKRFDKIERKTEEKSEQIAEALNITPTAAELMYQPLYNRTAKLLGVDSVADWSKNYDSVYEIVEKAKEKLNTNDEEKIIPWIYKMLNAAPNITNRKLNDLKAYLALGSEPKEKKTKVIVKKVVKYIRPKNTVDNFVNNLMSLKI